MIDVHYLKLVLDLGHSELSNGSISFLEHNSVRLQGKGAQQYE